MTSGFGGKNLRTSRANFEGLRAISECGTVFYRACGTKKLSLPVLGELGGKYWVQREFLRWPFPGQMTTPSEHYFYWNQRHAIGPVYTLGPVY